MSITHSCQKLRLLKLIKINFIMPKDIAITSSKSDVDPCSHSRDPDRQKSADRQMAFQLYIVDKSRDFSREGQRGPFASPKNGFASPELS